LTGKRRKCLNTSANLFEFDGEKQQPAALGQETNDSGELSEIETIGNKAKKQHAITSSDDTTINTSKSKDCLQNAARCLTEKKESGNSYLANKQLISEILNRNELPTDKKPTLKHAEAKASVPSIKEVSEDEEEKQAENQIQAI